jgi:hypothetical protein
MKVVDYVIVTEDTTGEMTRRVRKEMKDGWQPIGPAFPFNPHAHLSNPGRTFLAQTMVKYEEPK